MKGLLKLSPIVISVIILLCATTTRQNLRPMYTTGISITADNKMAIANKGTNDVVLLSESGESEQRWEFAESPTGITSYGSNIYVTSSQDEGYITAINLENNNIAYKTATGMGACAPVMSHDGKKVYVLNRYKATVTEVDAASGEVLR